MELIDITKQKIQKLCQPWLKLTSNGKQWVYRGSKIIKPSLIPQIYSGLRISRDSEPRLHFLFDEIIESKGLIANRSNGMFVTGNSGFAMNYGNTGIVVPIGDVHFTWSDDLRDWYADDAMHDAMFCAFDKTARDDYWLDSEANSIRDIQQNNPEEFQKHHEILKNKSKLPFDVINDPRLKQEMTYFKKSLYGDDDTLKIAIESGHEILLYFPSKQYFFLSEADYKTLFFGGGF